MDIPPIISLRKHERNIRVNDAILRSSAAVVFGLIAIWFPLSWARQDLSNAEAFAPLSMYGLMFVSLFTFLAAKSLFYAHRAPASPTGRFNFWFAAALVFLGALPLIFGLVRVALVAFRSLTMGFLH